jgi:prepilin-type N-terminal cleavage/methylation domain-containing protein
MKWSLTMHARGNPQRGFSLMELLTVVAIFAIGAALALVAINRSSETTDVDAFATNVRNAMVQARRRAVATEKVYLLELKAHSVAWCQVANTTVTTCAGLVGVDASAPVVAGSDSVAMYWTKTMDQGQGALPQLTMPGLVYFRPNGTVDSDPTTAVPDGFTAYLQGATHSDVRRKVVLYGVEGRPRISDTW